MAKKLASLNDVMDHMTDFVRSTYDPKAEINFHPMWTIIGEDGSVIPVVAPAGSNEEKDMVAETVKLLIKIHNAHMLGFLAESWTVSSKDGGDVTENTIPSEHPKRRECVFFAVEDRFGRGRTGVMEITRDADGNGVLGHYKAHDYSHHEGRFANMFGTSETVN